MRRCYASCNCQARQLGQAPACRGLVEWHPGEQYPRVEFIVANLSRPVERVVASYNQRGTAEQYIKEGKNTINWTRLSCHSFRNNEVRLQLHALAYNLGNFLGTFALPDGHRNRRAHYSLQPLRPRRQPTRRWMARRPQRGHVRRRISRGEQDSLTRGDPTPAIRGSGHLGRGLHRHGAPPLQRLQRERGTTRCHPRAARADQD